VALLSSQKLTQIIHFPVTLFGTNTSGDTHLLSDIGQIKLTFNNFYISSFTISFSVRFILLWGFLIAVTSVWVYIVITLICTRHAYLASSHLIFLLCQNIVEQLFVKTPFIKAHTLYYITSRVYMLVDPRQPVCTYKSTKKENLLMEHTALGKLTKPFGHAWPEIRPNT
jgi:hypothetical protein